MRGVPVGIRGWVEAIAALLVLGVVGPAALATEPPLLDARQQRVFVQTCGRCHLRPGIGVPLLGDAAAWEPLRAQGFELLVTHTIEGVGDMPPLGTCSYCSETDIRRMVAFLLGLSRLPAPDVAPVR